jgi:hypothetical protein
MGTLTYPCEFPTNGEKCKRDIECLSKRYERMVDHDPSFSFFWFLEFQQRGAPHFHFFCTHEIDKSDLSRWWFEIVGSGDERHLLAGTGIEFIRSGRHGTCSYASKYAAKHEQKVVPANFQNVGRFWGVIGFSSCMSATILFRLQNGQNWFYTAFLEELRAIIKNAGIKSSFKRFGPFTFMLYLKNEEVKKQISTLFYRYGTLVEANAMGVAFDCAFEYPLKE